MKLMQVQCFRKNIFGFNCCHLHSLTFYYCKQQEEATILNVQVVITHALLCIDMLAIFVCTTSKNEWSVENVIRLCAFQPSTSRNVVMLVLTICEVKLMQSTLIEEKHLYLWLLSPSVMLSKPLLISSY